MQQKIIIGVLILLILIPIINSQVSIDPIDEGLDDKEIGKEKPQDTLVSRSASSDTYKTPSGFQTTFYPNTVNLEYGNSFIPIEDFFNLTTEENNLKISDLDGQECIISPEFELESKSDITKTDFHYDIQKLRGQWYFTQNTSKDLAVLHWNVVCNGEVTYNIETDDLILPNDLKIDFTRAKEEQNISTFYNLTTNKLEFKSLDGNLSRLKNVDPSVTYNFNSTFQGINIWSSEAWNLTQQFNVPNAILPMTQNFVDNTGNSDLDSSDDSKVVIGTLSDGTDMGLFNFTTSIRKEDINNLSILIEMANNGGVGNITGYLWNVTSSSWVKCINPVTSSSDTTASCEFIGNVSSYFTSENVSTFVIWQNANARGVTVDFFKVSLTYDDLIINSPTNNQQILNTLSTTLNTSQIGYNNTLWYTWNNGVKNTTLCTISNECQSTITFPRQGYYNLTVYGNNSDGAVTSKTATNVFAGIQVASSFRDFSTIYGVSASSCPRLSSLSGNPPSCVDSLTSITSDSDLDASDDLSVITDSGSSGSGFFHFKINVSDIKTPFNKTEILFEGANGDDGQTNRLYLYNQSSGSWDEINATAIGIDQDDHEYTAIITSNNNYKTDGYIYVTWVATSSSPDFASADYMSINIEYFNYSNIFPSIRNLTANNTLFGSTSVGLAYNITDDNDYVLSSNLTVWNSTGSVVNTNSSAYPTLGAYNYFNFTLSLDGTYLYQFNSTDSDGAKNSTEILTFRIDTGDPTINILFPLNSSNLTYNNPHINYSVSDPEGNQDLTSCKYSKNGGTTNTSLGTCQNITDETFSEGLNTVNLWVSDSAGNEGTNLTTFRVDTTAPVLSIVHPTPSQGFNINSIQVNYTISETGVGLSSCWYRNHTDSTNVSITCGNNFTVSQGSDGIYQVFLWANDTLNNLREVQRTYQISSTAPAISLDNPTSNKFFQNGLNILFNFTAIDTDGINTCQLYGNFNSSFSLNQSITSALSGVQTNFARLNLTEGAYLWNVLCNDTINNFGLSATNFTVTIDETKPNIVIAHPQNTSYNSVSRSLNFTATDTNLESCWYSDNLGITNNTLTNCLNTTYTASQGSTKIIVYANDSANNLNSTNITFFVDSINPSISIVYPSANTNTSNTQIGINYTLVETNPNVCKWSEDEGGVNTTINCGTNITGVTWTEGENNITIYVNDTLNNRNYASVLFNLDTIYPQLNITTPLTTQGSQTVRFNHTASDLRLSTCFYSVINSTGGADIENTTLNCNGNNTQFVVSDFGNYNLTFFANDSAGNTNQTTQSFITLETSVALSTGGSGGAFRISVVALIKPVDYDKDITDLQRAIIYAKLSKYSVSDIKGISVSQLDDLRKDIEKEGISLSNDELENWINSYTKNQIENVLVTEEGAEKYNLVLSTVVILPPSFSLSPKTIERYFILSACLGGDNTYDQPVTSSKELTSCFVESADRTGFSCDVSNNPNSAKVTFKESAPNYFSKRVEAIVQYTSDTDSVFQPVGLNVVNICHEYVGIPFWIMFISGGFIVFIVFGAFLKSKQGSKTWKSVKKQF